jgi:hypothetical protein
MALPSLADLSMKQKALGIGIVAITGLVLAGQGKTLKSKKKKLPSGGKADYMKSLGGGGGGGGGSRGSSATSKKTSSTPDDSTLATPEGTLSISDSVLEQEPLTSDSSLLDLLNYNVPEEEQISTQEEALGQLEQLQEQNPNAVIEYNEQDGLTLDLFPDWDGPTWFNPSTAVGMQNLDELDIVTGSEATSNFWGGDWDWQANLQQGIADGTAFSWLNDDSTEEVDDTPAWADVGIDPGLAQGIADSTPAWADVGIDPGLAQANTNEVEEIEGCTDPASHSYNPDATVDDGSCMYYSGRAEENVYEATDNWLQNYVTVETIELEETDTPPLDPALANAFRSKRKGSLPPTFSLNR